MAYGVSVAEFGADGKAVQAALDTGAPRVVVPAGRYVVERGLRVGSGTHLLLHPRAELVFADGAGRDETCFLLTNADPAEGNADIMVEGGIWHGNAARNPRGPDAPGSYSGVMVNFVNVSDLTLRGMTLIDAESYFVRLGKVRGFRVEEIDFQIRHLRPNQDGIHVTGFCEDGVIRRLRALGEQTPNDDMVALLADDALGRAQNLNGAFNGPIRRVRVEDVEARSCHSFLRLLSVDHPIEDIEVRDVRGGCRCAAINMDACRECRVRLFDEADRPDGVGDIRRVRVRGMEVYRASDHTHQPLIDFRTRATDLVIEDFRRDGSRDMSPATPTLRMWKAGAIGVALEGLTPAQCAEVPGLAAEEMAGSGETLYRAAGRLSGEDGLMLRSGGFARLAVS
jgi:hypothetical protein